MSKLTGIVSGVILSMTREIPAKRSNPSVSSPLSWSHHPDRKWQWVLHYAPVMVKAPFLGLLAAMICGLACAAPAPQTTSLNHKDSSYHNHHQHHNHHNTLEDQATRSERSTNLSHITGTARKIQMFIKNRHLQLLPDGTVNGTTDDSSAYSKF